MSRDDACIFLCLEGQGNPGTWMSLFLQHLDEYFELVKANGAVIKQEPQDEPWGAREFHR